uniref:Uncharacterized protein n=1 Tax=viral metagenome TaxID=1070528 RepID=A0A6C0CG07_9ZZZZ
MKNIHNSVSDVQEFITTNHFPVVGNVLDTVDGWTVVEFKNANNDIIRLEAHLQDHNACVLLQRGFTNDQRDLLMDTFMRLVFPE